MQFHQQLHGPMALSRRRLIIDHALLDSNDNFVELIGMDQLRQHARLGIHVLRGMYAEFDSVA